MNLYKDSSHKLISKVEEARLNQLAINLYFFTGVLATAAFVARWSIEGFLYSKSLYLNFIILPILMFGFPLIIKKTGKRVPVTALFVVLALAFLFVRIIHTGGAYSPMMAWLMPIPFLGFFVRNCFYRCSKRSVDCCLNSCGVVSRSDRDSCYIFGARTKCFCSYLHHCYVYDFLYYRGIQPISSRLRK